MNALSGVGYSEGSIMVATAAACWWLVEAPPPPAMRFSGCCWVPEELSWAPPAEGYRVSGEGGRAVTLAFGVFGPEAKRLGVVLVEGEDLLLLPLTAFGGGDPRALHVRRALKPSALTAIDSSAGDDGKGGGVLGYIEVYGGIEFTALQTPP
nr:hypothetical protein Itr_chr15CG03400 [Ipomoea trifida]